LFCQDVVTHVQLIDQTESQQPEVVVTPEEEAMNYPYDTQTESKDILQTIKQTL